MNAVARFGLATRCAPCEPSAATVAVLGGLARLGLRVQQFSTRACPDGPDLAGALTGLPGRHLDPWLMSPVDCRDVFLRGTRDADLAVVEGPVRWPHECAGRPEGLGPLADALDLPVLAVVPCSGWDGFHLPELPRGVEGVVLDGVERPEDVGPLRRLFSVLAGVPVLAVVDALPGVRERLRRDPTRVPMDEECVDALVASFRRHLDLPELLRIAASRPRFEAPHERGLHASRRFRVAFAHDDAFGFYFADMLESLEARGAELVEFSPLKHGTLPAGAELVLIGCGATERHAEALAGNLSLIGSLHSHVCQGRRIYAEGGGAAYLCRRVIVEGRSSPGADILPIEAVWRPGERSRAPVSRPLTRDSWLGPAGTVVRGYPSARWRFREAPDADPRGACSGALTASDELYHHHHAVGSLIHLHPASRPGLADAWSGPHRPSLALPTARG